MNSKLAVLLNKANYEVISFVKGKTQHDTIIEYRNSKGKVSKATEYNLYHNLKSRLDREIVANIQKQLKLTKDNRLENSIILCDLLGYEFVEYFPNNAKNRYSKVVFKKQGELQSLTYGSLLSKAVRFYARNTK